MSKRKAPTNLGEELGRLVLTKDSVPDPSVLGDKFEKFLITLYIMDLYDPSYAVFSRNRISMPDTWHLIFRELSAYFKTVKKSRKKPRAKRTARK